MALLETYRNQLEKLIGKPCHFRLLYKISRDGCNAQTFHQKCDGQGPTVTVLYNTDGMIFGGYLSQSWNSSGAYIKDDNAFLFSLRSSGSSSPLKFPVIQSNYAGYGDSNYGPTFGNGNDIRTFTGNLGFSPGQTSLNGYVDKLGHSYNIHGQNIENITKNNLKVTDLEVYTVEDPLDDVIQTIKERLSAVEKKMEDKLSAVGKKIEDPVKSEMSGFSLLVKPWRKYPALDAETKFSLKKEIVDYDPEKKSKNTPVRNILLIGQIGAGKSSFFNSVNSVFRGKITNKACSGSFEHSLTTVFRKYSIRDSIYEQTLKLRLCDTRGLEEDSTVDTQDIVYILEGNVPDRYQFNPSTPMTSETLGFVRNPELGDMIHCVAFVVDGSTVDVMPEKILKQIKALQTRMNQKCIPQVVYLTKLDKVCPAVDEDVKHVFYSAAVRDAVDKIADVMGLPRSNVLPIKNYENETDLDVNMDILILKALKQTINFADDYIEEQMEKINVTNE